MNKRLAFLVVLALVLGSCRSSRSAVENTQGIDGYLYRVSGNQMPGPGANASPPRGAEGNLYIYELTNASQAVKQGETAFYTSVTSKLVKQVETNKKGYFSVRLAPGKYSVFIRKDTVLYANRFDAQNNIAPVEVMPGKFTRIEVKADYDAVY